MLFLLAVHQYSGRSESRKIHLLDVVSLVLVSLGIPLTCGKSVHLDIVGILGLADNLGQSDVQWLL